MRNLIAGHFELSRWQGEREVRRPVHLPYHGEPMEIIMVTRGIVGERRFYAARDRWVGPGHGRGSTGWNVGV